MLGAFVAALFPALLVLLVPMIARLPGIHRGWSTSQRARARILKIEEARRYHLDRARALQEQMDDYKQAGHARDRAYIAMTRAPTARVHRRAMREYKAARRAWRAAQPVDAVWEKVRQHERLFEKYDKAIRDVRAGQTARDTVTAVVATADARRERARAERAGARASRRARQAVAKTGPPAPRMHRIPVPGVATMPTGTIDT